MAYKVNINDNTFKRLADFWHSQDLDTLLNLACDLMEKYPYDYFKLPVCSRPRHRKLGTIAIGESRPYLIPASCLDEFLNSTYSYARQNKRSFRIKTEDRLCTVYTAVVTRIA